jgi:hypothetical protein
MSRNISRQAHLQYAHAVKYVSDLRVVYEIQSRLREDDNQLRSPETTPAPKSENDPNDKNDHTRTQPKQQNRVDERLARQFEMLAAEFPAVLGRSAR